MVHMFANEMLPSCRHCAKYHLTKEQQRHQQQQQLHQAKRLQRDKNQECFTSPQQSEKYMWPLSVRKRPNKHEKSLNNESGRNQSNAEHTISRQNSLATRSNNIDSNDQYLQCSSGSGSSNNNHISITMLAETSRSSKMNGLSTGDANTSISTSSLSPPPPPSSSNGALDDHPQCVQSFDMQMWPSIEMGVTLRSTSLSLSSSSSPSSSSSASPTSSSTSLETSSSAAAALHCSQWPTNQTCSDFSRNMHMDNINLTSFSVNDRLASENANDDRDDASDLNQCINKNGIVPNGSSSRSVRTDSANNNDNNNNCCANKHKQNNSNSNNNNNQRQRRKHAYANQRWPYAISSTMNIYSHVLLICVAFIVFGIRNALVLADDTPANTKELAIAENGGSEYTIQLNTFSMHFILIFIAARVVPMKIVRYESCSSRMKKIFEYTSKGGGERERAK